jgi:pimeloyl-ACP methyl ester carboxylesterase
MLEVVFLLMDGGLRTKEKLMAIYLLVHGATAGGWQWREVATRLQSTGHEVFRPTLTGLGERSHLLTPALNLQTHIQDIVGILTYEDLSEVILVGKSYSGVVITGVAERAAERIRHLMYLDAVVPESGLSIMGLAGEAGLPLQTVVQERGDSWLIPVNREIDPRLTPHPFRTFTDPLLLHDPRASQLPRTYIVCLNQPPGTMHARLTSRAVARAKAEGWRYRELLCGPNAEQEKPQAVTELLLEVA